MFTALDLGGHQGEVLDRPAGARRFFWHRCCAKIPREESPLRRWAPHQWCFFFSEFWQKQQLQQELFTFFAIFVNHPRQSCSSWSCQRQLEMTKWSHKCSARNWKLYQRGGKVRFSFPSMEVWTQKFLWQLWWWNFSWFVHARMGWSQMILERVQRLFVPEPSGILLSVDMLKIEMVYTWFWFLVFVHRISEYDVPASYNIETNRNNDIPQSIKHHSADLVISKDFKGMIILMFTHTCCCFQTLWIGSSFFGVSTN